MSKFAIQISFQSGFHHGSGYGFSGLVDRAIQRDCDGLPFLAGSAIKGKLRHAAVQVALALDVPVCQVPERPEMCKREPFCSICSLFGSAFRQGKLRFSDAYPVGPENEVLHSIAKVHTAGVYHRDSSVRFGVGINRVLGRAQSSFLFSTEVLPPDLTFSASVAGDMSPEEKMLVKQACRIIAHFGSGRARGLGNCRFDLVEA